MPRPLALLLAAGLAACTATAPMPPAPSASAGPTPSGWRQHDMTRPQPPRVEPAASALPVAPPSDAVVLIGPDGSGLTNWEAEGGGAARWQTQNGALVAAPGAGGIRTKALFGDVQVHVEWMPAAEPDKHGQDRSNSGLFFVDGRYEVQVLDSWDNRTYADGRAASLYGQYPPLADATRPPTEWQAYDVYFRMPRFDATGAVTEPARVTVVHNGVLVQNNEVLTGGTMWLETLPYEAHGPGRISLQDHGSPVRFRNLWVRAIPERAEPPAGSASIAAVPLAAADRDRLVGTYTRDEGGEFVVERVGDGLGLSMPWRPGVLRMIPVSATSFELAHTAGRLDFEVTGDTITGVSFTLGGATYHATRDE